MANTLENTAQKLGSKARDLISKAEKGAANFEDQAYEVGTKAKELYHRGEERVKDGVEYLEDQVRTRPLVALGSAFALGFVLAKLFSVRD